MLRDYSRKVLQRGKLCFIPEIGAINLLFLASCIQYITVAILITFNKISK